MVNGGCELRVNNKWQCNALYNNDVLRLTATNGRTFSILYLESAMAAISIAYCCIVSDMSAFLMIAFRCCCCCGCWCCCSSFCCCRGSPWLLWRWLLYSERCAIILDSCLLTFCLFDSWFWLCCCGGVDPFEAFLHVFMMNEMLAEKWSRDALQRAYRGTYPLVGSKQNSLFEWPMT